MGLWSRFRLRSGAIVAISCAFAALVFGSVAYTQELPQYPTDIHALFRIVGNMYGIDPDLLEAIASVESRGNPDAISPKGAMGLMQLMPATAQRFSVLDAFDPVDNALGAARFIADLRRTLGATPSDSPDLPVLLAAYNAGAGAVIAHGGIPPYPETRDYVRRVLWAYLTRDGAQQFQDAQQSEDPQQFAAASIDRPRRRIGIAREKPPDPLRQLAEIRELRAAAIRSLSSVPLASIPR
jgi:hypothetical protein